MQVIIEAISKYGVLDSTTKKWINFKDKDALKKLNRGKAYNVTMGKVKGDDGKVREMVTTYAEVNTDTFSEPLELPKAPPVAAPKVEEKIKEVPKAKAFPAKTEGMTKEDWQNKDKAQMRGGRSHDAAELVKASLANATPMKKVLELYKEALDGVLKIEEEIR